MRWVVSVLVFSTHCYHLTRTVSNFAAWLKSECWISEHIFVCTGVKAPVFAVISIQWTGILQIVLESVFKTFKFIYLYMTTFILALVNQLASYAVFMSEKGYQFYNLPWKLNRYCCLPCTYLGVHFWPDKYHLYAKLCGQAQFHNLFFVL